MAHSDSDVKHVSQLLKEAQSLVSESSNVLQDGVARASLLRVCRNLTLAVEEPDELVSNVAFSGGRNMCVRVADDLKMFDLIAERPRTSHELAELTGADEILIIRIMRTLVATGFAAQDGKLTYSATLGTKQLVLPSVRAGVRCMYDEGLPIIRAMPEYFKANGYRCPKSMVDGPFQYAYRTDMDSYQYWQTKPGAMENFNTFMQGLFGTPLRLPWWKWFPVNEVVLDGYREEVSDVVFVDVGAGKGHETEALLKLHPDVKGRLVVQDLPKVIEDIQRLDPRIERMGCSFLESQPVRGARAYFLQNILHNWADPPCLTILKNLADVMVLGYSKLLISNLIIADQDPSVRQCGLDIAMLQLHSGSQRGEHEWAKLLDQAGLRIIKFWHPPGDGDGIVEAELQVE